MEQVQLDDNKNVALVKVSALQHEWLWEKDSLKVTFYAESRFLLDCGSYRCQDDIYSVQVIMEIYSQKCHSGQCAPLRVKLIKTLFTLCIWYVLHRKLVSDSYSVEILDLPHVMMVFTHKPKYCEWYRYCNIGHKCNIIPFSNIVKLYS